MGGLVKRKSFILLMFLAFAIIGTTGFLVFGRSNKKDVDQNLLREVKEIEKSAHELNTVKITYDEYSQRTNKYKSKYFTSFYKGQLIFYADQSVCTFGNHFEEKYWKGMSLADLKKKVEPALPVLSGQYPGFFYTSYDISKVFNDNFDSDSLIHFKYIYIKFTLLLDNNYTCYKQYTFKNEGNNYVLFSIKGLANNMKKELMYRDEKVEFTENIDLNN